MKLRDKNYLVEKIFQSIIDFSKNKGVAFSSVLKQFKLPYNLEKLNYKQLTGIKGTLNKHGIK